MKIDEFERNWKQMRFQLKEQWGALTDDDLDRAAGKSSRIVELLQQAYAYTRKRAEEEFNQWLTRAALPQT
jgi:uncharacterized protein YjbJ (UPF0337 family)